MELFRPIDRCAIPDEVRTLLAQPTQGEAPTATRESWVQIARSGTWSGHAAGEFTFDSKVYEQIVANFRATANQLPVDFEHAAEMGPKDGVSAYGAPAQAWVTDLRYTTDGLEALFRWTDGQPGREYVRQGAYRYTSPAVSFNATDRKTAQRIGAELHSVALTNRPFLDGMRAVAAKDQRAEAPEETTRMPFANDILAKLLSCDATDDAITAKLTALVDDSAKLVTLSANAGSVRALSPEAHAIHALTCKSLALPDTATEADVSAKLMTLSDRAKLADSLEPEVIALRASIAAHEKADAEGEVDFILSNGGTYGRKFEATDRDSLLALRAANPKAFGATFKVVLDARKRGDTPHLFSQVTPPATPPKPLPEGSDGSGNDVTQLAAQIAKDEQIPLSQAMSLAHSRLLKSANT